MTPRRQCRQINRFLDTLQAAELAIYTRGAVVRESTGEYARVTWPRGPRATVGDLFLGDFYSVDTYCNWLESQELSAILFDGSILQLTFDFLGRDLAGHRLAYIPCPFVVDDDIQLLLQEEPVLDVILLLRAEGERFLRMRAPIRFDYDPDAGTDEHPASHLTMNHSECRVPAHGPLSLGHFVDFVFRHFYPDEWREYDFLREQPKDEFTACLRPGHETQLHIAWRSAPSFVAGG